MEGTSQGRSTVDIQATVQRQQAITDDCLAAHFLSGCDTTAYLHGIGKITVARALKAGNNFRELGDFGAYIKTVIDESTSFIPACCGCKGNTENVLCNV